jgi:hypothetical protein
MEFEKEGQKVRSIWVVQSLSSVVSPMRRVYDGVVNVSRRSSLRFDFGWIP